MLAFVLYFNCLNLFTFTSCLSTKYAPIPRGPRIHIFIGSSTTTP